MATEATTANLMPNLAAGLRPLLLLVGLAAAVAAGVGVTLWTKGPTFSVLYATLADEEAAAVTRSLSGAGIEYRMEAGSGGISVPAERLNEARMLLAEQGTLQSGGFANLGKEGGFGVSAFMEGARYQHALETELAKTISSLQQVAAARVHIAAGRNSSFIRDRTPARASVFLQLKAGRKLSSEQVTAIVNLVGSSVADIDPEQVTVVDQTGRLLSSPQGRGEFALRDQQVEFARQMEEMYSQRVEALIAPLVGPGRVRAEVSAQFDMSASEEAREQFNPQGVVVRSEQLSEDRSSNPVARGIPGSASNQANAAAATPANPADAANAATATAANAATPPPPASVQSTRNYEIDRTVAYTRQPAGRLKRLSVAVLVDNVQVPGRDGKPTDAPLTREQIERITALVKDAVGFDAARGDSVSIINSPWRGDPRLAATDLESVPFYEQAWFLDVAKIVAGLIALTLLMLMVIRPLTQRITAMLPSPPEPTEEQNDRFIPSRNLPAVAGAAGEAGQPGTAIAGAGPAESTRKKPPTKYDEQVEFARQLVQEDPARVAQVVRKWAMSNG
jgi:flagellar M-ring protein FliF